MFRRHAGAVLFSIVVGLASTGTAQARDNPYVNAAGRVDHAALNRDCQGVPPYSRQWGGINSKASAELTADTLTRAVSAVKPFVAPGATLNAQARLSFVRTLVGGYGADANLQVTLNYFCRLQKVYPEKAAAIDLAREEVVLMMADLYDPSLSQLPYAEYQAARGSIINTAKAAKPVLTDAEVVKAIDDFKYDSRLTIEANVKGAIGGDSVDACVATSVQSIEVVDQRILKSLSRLRSTLAQYLAGDGVVAVTLWMAAPRDIYTNPNSAAPNLTVADVTCLDKVAKEVAEKAAETAPGAT